MEGIAARLGRLSWLSEGNGFKWFLHSCPFALLLSPAVSQVIEAFAWWEKGQLQIRYPAGIPLRMAKAILDYEHGKIRGTNDKYERDRRKRKHNG